MSKEIDEIKEKIAALRASSDRLQSEANNHEYMFRSGEDDYRHVIRISDCYKQIAENSYDEGRLSAKLDFIQDQSENRLHDVSDKQTESRWDARQDHNKKDQDNWWRPSQADERPEPSPDDDRAEAPSRR